MILTPGVFKARKIAHQWTTAKTTGSPGLVVWVEIDDGVSDVPEKISGTIWITEKSAGMARAQFKALGHDMDKTDLSAFDDSDYLNEVEIPIVLEEHTYLGRTEIRIARFGGNMRPSDDVLKRAQTMMRTAKKSPATLPPSVITAEEAKRVAEQAEADGSDIPF